MKNPRSNGIQLANKFHRGQGQWKDIIKIGSLESKLTNKILTVSAPLTIKQTTHGKTRNTGKTYNIITAIF